MDLGVLVRAGFMHIKCAITFFMTHMLQTEYRIIHYFHWTNLRSRYLITLDLLKGQGRKEIANIKEEPKRSTIAVVSYIEVHLKSGIVVTNHH